MEEENRDSGDITLSINAEDPFARFKRVGILVLSIVAGMGAVLTLLSGDGLVMMGCIMFGLLLSLASRLGRQRLLVLRNRDLFTIGDDLDRPVPWSEIAEITTVGTGAELVLHNGQRRPLRLRFLSPAFRNEAIVRISRHLEIHRLYGPLRLPSFSDAEIRSDRISLRPTDRYDRDFCVSIATSEDSSDYQLAGVGTPEMAAAVYDETLATYRQGQEWWRFIVLAADTPVGAVSLHVNDLILRHAQLGIDIATPFQSQGYGSEAIRALLGFFSEHSNLTRVAAGCFSDNPRCRKALEKAGMKRVGTFARFWLKGSLWKSGEHYEIDLVQSPGSGD